MSDDDLTQAMPTGAPLPELPLPEPAPAEKPRGPVGMVIGDYEVEGVLGRGGMGVVYRARQGKLNRQVALKMLTGHFGSDEMQRFLVEAQTAAALHHANIVHIYEVGESEGSPFFSMEFVEGGPLSRRLRQGLLPPRETAALLATVARALHFAHQHGVVHRDMKPANILLDPDGAPKVADFGIAKRLDNDSHLTRSGAIVGTPAYMAPEQAGGTGRDVGPAADVYSLGAILYEMLAGRPPYLAEESDTAISVRVLTEETPSPASHRPQTPRELDVICMKCLQKNPRERYASAAALAEDLRRFLDDEPIIARPPSRLVRTIKWVRRNPWKFVVRAGLAALLAFGAERLFHWEFYQRPHFEYAIAIDHIFGRPSPMGAVSAAETARRGDTLRFTRRGRWGQVTAVESVNSRGRPGIVRELYGYDPLPNFIEGFLGARDVTREQHETTAIDYLYEGAAVVQATGRDSNGIVNWRILYERSTTPNPRQARGRCVTDRGFDFASQKGASVIEIERDGQGRDSKALFYAGSGERAANSEGVYGYAVEHDAAGRITRLENLGENGAPSPNNTGAIIVDFRRDARGLVTRMEVRDAAGQPTTWQGLAAVASEYDADGNAVRMTRLDAAGRPTNGKANDWAVQEFVRNSFGETIERRFLAAGSDGQLSPRAKVVLAYDGRGYPIDIRITGSLNWRTALQHDDRGNILEEKYLGADGLPINGAQGWAIHRHAYQFSANGTREEETWFDARGAPAYNKAGAHRTISEFDSAGKLRRYATEENDPARFHYQRYVSEPKWDAQGRLRHGSLRFEDANGQLAVNAGLKFTQAEEDFDENGREITSLQLGWSEKDFGASIWRKDTEWRSTGVMRRLVWQAYDANRQPLHKISNTDPARIEEDYDETGRLEHKLETEFDEARLGFHSRELQFKGGALESVIIRKSDGTELKTVRVMVRAILKDAQPRASELRVGDQFLTANGVPVRNAYDWMLASNFAGGWIEVLREGVRLRIDGFEPGKLGVLLEDRGADVP